MYADSEFAAGLANYHELAANFARRCRERRNTEEAQREELAALTKPATVCKSNDVGVLVHKIHDDNVRVADDDDGGTAVERTVSAKPGSQTWWQWVDRRLEDRLCEFGEQVTTATGGAMAEWVGEKLDPIKRELALLRHEFIVLREDFALAKSLHELQNEVAEARKQVPKIPAIVDEFEARQNDLAAEQARLERELAKTKDKLSNLRVEQGLDRHSISQLEKAASKATASIEMQTSVARFSLRGIHPDAAKALSEFAAQVVDAEDGGAIWGRCLTLEATAGAA